MKLGTVFPNKFLKAEDITADISVVISKILFEKMEDKDGATEDKPVLYFLRMDKGLVLNKTNAMRIADQFSDETDNWLGKQITLTVESVEAFGKTQWAIRVKPVRKVAPAAAAPALAAAHKVESEEEKKERFLGLFNLLGLYATPVFRKHGLVLDTESYRDISASKVATMKKVNVEALLEEVRREAGAAEEADTQAGF